MVDLPIDLPTDRLTDLPIDRAIRSKAAKSQQDPVERSHAGQPPYCSSAPETWIASFAAPITFPDRGGGAASKSPTLFPHDSVKRKVGCPISPQRPGSISSGATYGLGPDAHDRQRHTTAGFIPPAVP